MTRNRVVLTSYPRFTDLIILHSRWSRLKYNFKQKGIHSEKGRTKYVGKSYENRYFLRILDADRVKRRVPLFAIRARASGGRGETM